MSKLRTLNNIYKKIILCYNYYGDYMKIKKLLKTTITVIIVVVICYLIYDNYYLFSNKLEYLYSKYISKNIKQTLNSNEYQKKVANLISNGVIKYFS